MPPRLGLLLSSQGLRPKAYNALLKGLIRRGASVPTWLSRMRAAHVRPNTITYSTILGTSLGFKASRQALVVRWQGRIGR